MIPSKLLILANVVTVETPVRPGLNSIAYINHPDLQLTDALVAAQKLKECKESPAILVLSGGVGCGKSQAAAWYCVRAKGLWADAFEMMMKPQNGWSTNEEAWNEWLMEPVLVIDDFGAFPGAESTGLKIGALLMARWNAGRVTIITTNLGMKDFASAVFGTAIERLADRLRENPIPWFQPCLNKSLRASHE